MNVTSIVPKSWIKNAVIAAIGMVVGYGSNAIQSQVGKEYDLGYGAKLVVTQDIADKGTNAVAIIAQKVVTALQK